MVFLRIFTFQVILVLLGPLMVCTINGAQKDVQKSYKLNRHKLANLKDQDFLREAEQCNTEWNTKFESSGKFRRLIFEAGKNSKLASPELLFCVTGKTPDDNACCGLWSRKIDGTELEGVGVNFNEPYWKKQSWGAARFVAHHEMAHASLRHYRSKDDGDNTAQRKRERDADKMAALTSNCQECSRAFVERYLTFNKEDHAVNPKYYPYPELTLKELDKMHDDTLNKRIEEAELLSLKRDSTHPVHIERALRVYRYTRLYPKIRDGLCTYHQERKMRNALIEMLEEDAQAAVLSVAEKLRRTVSEPHEKARKERLEKLQAYRKTRKALREIQNQYDTLIEQRFKRRI